MSEQPAAGAPSPAGRELFIRHARRDGRSVAIMRAVDYGDSCIVEAEIFPWQTRPYDLVSPPTRVSFTAALMAPRSRGRFDLGPGGPRLRVGHLAEDADAADMAEIVATTAELLESLAKDGVVVIGDDAWWRRGDDPVAAARAAASSYHHHSGTCRMGDPDADGTVVGQGYHERAGEAPGGRE